MIGILCDYTSCSNRAVCTAELTVRGASDPSPRPRDYCQEHAADRLGELALNRAGLDRIVFTRIKEEK